MTAWFQKLGYNIFVAGAYEDGTHFFTIDKKHQGNDQRPNLICKGLLWSISFQQVSFYILDPLKIMLGARNQVFNTGACGDISYSNLNTLCWLLTKSYCKMHLVHLWEFPKYSQFQHYSRVLTSKSPLRLQAISELWAPVKWNIGYIVPRYKGAKGSVSFQGEGMREEQRGWREQDLWAQGHSMVAHVSINKWQFC